MLLVIQCYFLNCHVGDSLVIQWLGIHASTAGGKGSTPGWGTKILHIVWPQASKQTKLSCKDILLFLVIIKLLQGKEKFRYSNESDFYGENN